MKPPLHIERFIARHFSSRKSVLYRHSDRVVREFLEDPYAPVLISFPRTGSHQLRLLMELYFKRPSLPRIFLHKKSRNFTCCHLHDLIPPDRPAGVERKRVIYLYREAGATVHSVMKYYGEDTTDPERVDHWSTVYGEHLRKWLLEENASEEKLKLRYETLQTEPETLFRDLSGFFGESHDPEHLKKALEMASKEKVGELTKDNPSIIGDPEKRKEERERFLEEFEQRIHERILSLDPRLGPFMEVKQEKS